MSIHDVSHESACIFIARSQYPTMDNDWMTTDDDGVPTKSAARLASRQAGHASTGGSFETLGSISVIQEANNVAQDTTTSQSDLVRWRRTHKYEHNQKRNRTAETAASSLLTSTTPSHDEKQNHERALQKETRSRCVVQQSAPTADAQHATTTVIKPSTSTVIR
ncbi:uncharacterized protein MYCGRDRAFT_97637 [Zymoseptoria tritici IPO323]|uniref:Uncharacterized protein n=1 Tax=Zymoseptoria tritici (strain CBS 115943 / IPO323) TaxID=336722 RepID=F9XR30_ZYMTI|nr:uncharacterized protein MYCGRDRAFT_97637 [Zymoseptoria tritici IPO323]EGP82360.1 hypothetical protein MYCGRDRAFT_97637 [Zymoseptoria tritici IPO323]